MAFTSTITGGPLDKWVQKQIDIRQKVIGNNPEIVDLDKRILNNNNKNAWVRLASSVNIVNGSDGYDRLAEIDGVGNEFGNDLAKKYTLFGGVNFNPLNTKGGVYDGPLSGTATLAQPYSYGIGGTDQGYQPIPGLESVNIRHINRGAIRNFEIRIKAHNKTQFNIIETLYLRLGYYVLLEWGHTNYVNNEGEFVSNPVINSTYEKFIEGKADNEINATIYKDRKESCGNYDGALVKITNYNWSLENDGSYSIMLKGIGKGGLIDSLTLNYPGKTQNENYKPYFFIKPDNGLQDKVLAAYPDLAPKENDTENSLQTYIRIISQKAAEGEYENLRELGVIKDAPSDEGTVQLTFENVNASDNSNDDNVITITDQKKSFINEQLFGFHNLLKKTDWIQDKNGKNRFKKILNGEAISVKFDQADSDNEHGAYEYNYITLKVLLHYIKRALDEDPNNEGININQEYGAINMFTHFFQHSVNPQICLIPFTYYDIGEEEHKILFEELSTPVISISPTDETIFTTQNFRIENSSPTQGDERFQGKIMHAYINMEHIAKTLRKATDSETGEIGLYKFLYDLTGNLNGSLGGINNLNVTFNPNNEGGGGKLEIRDDTIIPGLGNIKEDDETTLRLYGTIPNVEGSFINNISSNSQISSKTVTQLAIGSTASGVNSSTAMLNRVNRGVEDRIQKKSNTKNLTNKETSDTLNEKLSIHRKFIEDTYVKFQKPSPSRIQTAQTNLKSILEYDLAIQTINGSIAGKGFIPITLSIEMQGLAGILMYQRIKPSEEVLPTSYNNRINFIVLALDHTIQNNTWTTTINTQSTPKKQDISESGPNPPEFNFFLAPNNDEKVTFTPTELEAINQL